MTRTRAKELFGWGTTLWFIGYVLGILLTAVVGPGMVGWVILPVGVAVTCWVLFRKIHGGRMSQYVVLGIAWTAIAVALDYLLIVKAFHPVDGYYKPDVYLYYVLTLALPMLVGWRMTRTARR
jgi:hypothetical protein